MHVSSALTVHSVFLLDGHKKKGALEARIVSRLQQVQDF